MSSWPPSGCVSLSLCSSLGLSFPISTRSCGPGPSLVPQQLAQPLSSKPHSALDPLMQAKLVGS